MLARLIVRPMLHNKALFAFASEVQPAKQKVKTGPTSIQTYKDGQLITRNQITLKKKEDIEGFVLSILRNYYRTTNKANLSLESTLLDHGLDSLDSIEISMQIEEELGYVISAETLPVLNKVKHYVNYIKQVEQFKADTQQDPLP